jgi:hypothetical protein
VVSSTLGKSIILCTDVLSLWLPVGRPIRSLSHISQLIIA